MLDIQLVSTHSPRISSAGKLAHFVCELCHCHIGGRLLDLPLYGVQRWKGTSQSKQAIAQSFSLAVTLSPGICYHENSQG